MGTGGNHNSALPLFEVSIKHPVWETLPANTDALQDTITAELMQDKECIHFACRGKTSQIKRSFSTGLHLHFPKETGKCEMSSPERPISLGKIKSTDSI